MPTKDRWTSFHDYGTMSEDYRLKVYAWIEEHSDLIQDPVEMFNQAPFDIQPGICEVCQEVGIVTEFGHKMICHLDRVNWKWVLE